MAKDSFIFYRSFYEAIKNVPKKHRASVYEAVFDYVFDNKLPTLCGVSEALWLLIKPQLDANRVRYENGLKGAEHGKKGGRPRKTDNEENPNGVISKTPSGLSAKTPNVNVNVNENVNENVNGNVNAPGVTTTTTTTAPTLSDINNYCKQNGILTNTGKFYAYNEARNWNGHPERWQSMLQLWKEREREKEPAELRKYDFDELERILVNRG